MLKNRHLRQIRLLGEKNQAKLSKLTVGIVGCGGIGSNSALLASQLGIKKIILMDRDKVNETDFNRQQFFESDLLKAKVEAVAQKINKMNSDVLVEAHFEQFDLETAKAMEKASIILDCTDNYSTRIDINRFCLKRKIPWVFASALKFEGMVSTIIPWKSACFECFAKKPKNELSCEDAGIMNTAVATIAAIQVQEVVNLFCFGKPNYANALFRMNLLDGLFEKILVDKNPKCAACAKKK
ncbi:HesA/MoeB/ThiF family protein [Candidatus Micrarchaeota archaeon]|nr:HesA/MoeB/ThiF family protein [Candidatus Micrarchaeota archaeon]